MIESKKNCIQIKHLMQEAFPKNKCVRKYDIMIYSFTCKSYLNKLKKTSSYKYYSIVTFYNFFMSLRSPSFGERIKDIAFNLRYHLLGYFEEYEKSSLLKEGDEIHILGNSFSPKENNMKQVAEEIFKIFMATPWFTYRSGFPQLPTQIDGSYVSDTGWGCMIRVGQMFFAQIIQQHRSNLTGQLPSQLQILNLFNDFDRKAPLSIQNIAKVARKNYSIEPGQWYNPSQIANILSGLFQTFCAKKDKLHFLVFNSGCIFFDSVLNTMFNYNVPSKIECTCIKQKGSLICEKCFEKRDHSSLSIIILSRIGIDQPETKYLTALEDMMTLKQFRGILGGKPKKALYFLGRHNKDYIYLDPHYVQKAQLQIAQIETSYVCESFRKCPNYSIDSSLGVCFYIKDIKDLNSFYDGIKKIKEKEPQNMFVFSADTTPNYMKQEKSEAIQLQNEDEDKFEEL